MSQRATAAAVTMPGDTPVWLKVPEAAARARCSRKIIYRAASDGRLRAATVGARGDLRFRPAWIDEWLENTSEPQEIIR